MQAHFQHYDHRGFTTKTSVPARLRSERIDRRIRLRTCADVLRFARLGSLGLAIATVPSCNELRARTVQRGDQTTGRDAEANEPGSSTARSGSGANAVRRLPRWPVENGCGRAWAPASDSDLSAALHQAAALCTPGLSPARPVPLEFALDGHAVSIPYPLDGASGCVRAIAVSSVDGIELALWRRDEMLAGASSSTRLVTIPPDGPVCLRELDELRLVLRHPADAIDGSARNPQGRAAVNVWFAKGE
jgi:hypothetical protein